MTIPANLFIDAPEMEDNSLSKLDGQAESWPEEIIRRFRERVPQTQNANIMVKFMKKDEENGAATGSLVITTSEKGAVVPIIIKDFYLYPLDVMIAAGKMLPLTSDYYNAHFAQKVGAFDKLEEFPAYGGLGRFDEANLWNAVYPPNMGRYAYASAGYPMMDLISETVDGSELKQWLKDNPACFANFKKHGHEELVTKAANLKPVNANEFRQGVDKLIPNSIALLRKEGPDKYSLLSSSDKVYAPSIHKLTRREAVDVISSTTSELSSDVQDTMNEVDQNGEKLLSTPEPLTNVILARPDDQLVERAESFDHYAVMNNMGVTVEGMVIPKVITFDQKEVKLKIFIGKTMQTIQEDVFGVRLKNSDFKLPCGDVPQVGQTGTFVFQPTQKHALATIPVTIRSISDDCGTMRMTASTLLGEGIKIAIPSFRGGCAVELKRIAFSDGVYNLPGVMKWVPMAGFAPVSNSKESFAVKTAGHKLSAAPVKLISTGYGQYAMTGVNKYAAASGWDHTKLARHQATFILASLGVGHKKIAEAIKEAGRRGHAELHHLSFIPLKAEKIAAARPRAKMLLSKCAAIRSDLRKEASFLDNAQTVDALLSLNFVNPDNIAKFVGKISQLKATISCLAGMLLASRVGIKEIPEQAASTAMHRLIEVVDGLEALRATQEVQAG